jgi:spermidine synthase
VSEKSIFRHRNILFVYFVTFILAACSLIYELLLAQTVSYFLESKPVSYSVILGLYLAALGVGALSASTVGREQDHWKRLLKVERRLSFWGGMAVAVIYAAHFLYALVSVFVATRLGIVIFIAVIAALIIRIGFLSGLEIPLLIKIGGFVSGNDKVTNRVLGLDYFGSLAGGLVFPLVLMSHFDLLAIGFMTALVNVLIAGMIYCAVLRKEEGAPGRSVIPVVLLAAVYILGFRYEQDIQQFFLKMYYHGYDIPIALNAQTPPVERVHSPYQKIDIVHYDREDHRFESALYPFYSRRKKAEGFPGQYKLFLNYQNQLSSDFEDAYHEYFAHIPVILNGRVPEEVLVLGAGDGLLVRELKKYPQVKKITLVELDEKMIELANGHPVFQGLNEGALRDPRVEVVIADAFSYVRDSRETYDAVYIDFPYHNNYDLSKLYSVEFYAFVHKRMRKGAYAVFDAPGMFFALEERNPEVWVDSQGDWPVYCNTLLAAGFENIVPYVIKLEELDSQQRSMLFDRLTNGADTSYSREEKDRVAQDLPYLISSFVRARMIGFIMMTKEGAPPRASAFPDIDFNVLNPERFNGAFPKYNVIKNISKINSIMRPTLPRTNALIW